MLEDALWLTAERDGLRVHREDGDVRLPGDPAPRLAALPAGRFRRVDRDTWVNLAHVAAVQRRPDGRVTLRLRLPEGGAVLPVDERYWA